MNARAQEMVLGWQRSVAQAWQRQSDLLTSFGGSAPLPTPPLKGATPQQYAAYLSTLNEEQLRIVAGKDGFAAELRDQANRTLLDRERERLRAEIAGERAEAAAARGPGGDAERLTSDFRADQLQATLNGLDALAGRIGSRQPGDDNGYFLLGYDSAGDGRAIVATHNPDTAAHVATFVPGADSDLVGFPGTVDRIDAIHAAATRVPGTPPTSVVAWFDYDSPEGYLVGGNGYAWDAREDLDSFQHGLRTSHLGEERSHNTVVGHSYGAVVAGIAAHEEILPVDDFVSVAGVGTGTRHASDLNLPVDHVWATEATADDLADLGRFLGGRPDPAAAEFGAMVFQSDAPVPLPLDAHSQYFHYHPENTGLNNIGDIVAGREPSRP